MKAACLPSERASVGWGVSALFRLRCLNLCGKSCLRGEWRADSLHLPPPSSFLRGASNVINVRKPWEHSPRRQIDRQTDRQWEALISITIIGFLL